MKKPRLLVALGLILAAAAAIVGLAAPGNQTQDVPLSVEIKSSFGLQVTGTLTWTEDEAWSGFVEDTLPSKSVTATATSNWPKGYTISVSAQPVLYTYEVGGPTEPTDADLITLDDITVQGPHGSGDLTASRNVVSATSKTGKEGEDYTISFFVTPDGDEYAGTYTTTVTFTMTATT